MSISKSTLTDVPVHIDLVLFYKFDSVFIKKLILSIWVEHLSKAGASCYRGGYIVYGPLASKTT